MRHTGKAHAHSSAQASILVTAAMTKLEHVLGTIAIPLVGVIWFEWAVYEVLLLYWFENIAIGVAHAMRLGICTRTNKFAAWLGHHLDRPTR